MIASMGKICFEKIQILWCIIAFIAVDVMDDFFCVKWAAKDLLCDKDVFGDVAAFKGSGMIRGGDENVAVTMAHSSPAPGGTAFARAFGELFQAAE